MTPPEPSAAPQSPSNVYLVFSPGGGLCMAHVSADAESTAASHASVVQGFVVKLPIHEDYREYRI